MTNAAMLRDGVSVNAEILSPLDLRSSIYEAISKIRRHRAQIGSALAQLDKPGANPRLPLLCLGRACSAHRKALIELDSLRGLRLRARASYAA